jgi:hypothetical protein
LALVQRQAGIFRGSLAIKGQVPALFLAACPSPPSLAAAAPTTTVQAVTEVGRWGVAAGCADRTGCCTWAIAGCARTRHRRKLRAGTKSTEAVVTPGEFLQTVVHSNVEEFNADYGNVRRAYNAVAAVDALAAHIYVWCKTNAPLEIAGVNDDSHYRGRLAGCSSDFRLLRDIAKAQKHVHLDDPSRRGKPEVTTSAQVTARPIAYGEGPYGGGRYGGPPQVVVTTDKGELRYVEQIVAAALVLLEAEMTRLNI